MQNNWLFFGCSKQVSAICPTSVELASHTSLMNILVPTTVNFVVTNGAGNAQTPTSIDAHSITIRILIIISRSMLLLRRSILNVQSVCRMSAALCIVGKRCKNIGLCVYGSRIRMWGRHFDWHRFRFRFRPRMSSPTPKLGVRIGGHNLTLEFQSDGGK